MALKSCCCGCSLKTGSLIVGYTYAVTSGVGVFMCILSMLLVGDIDFARYGLAKKDDEEKIQMLKAVFSKGYFVFALIFLKSAVVNWLLIHGINRMKPALVLPWIIFFAAGMAMQSFLYLSAIPLAFSIPTGLWYTVVAFLTLVLCIQGYILIVVSSHYHKMKKSSLLDEEQIMM